ncbi:unnamed protein product [Callosobruchus maculatus]|uniref:Uncharacterized protein n=1 Tax=Callosobruchus maculatus TaxID=64391 RepID=A0A653CC79_CALMS|nr:unnamed protein product [Callosobruchus maculatus]
MYISRPVSVENTVNSLQSILQRFVTGEQPLASLPNVIRSVGAVHRIRIDIKISIEKIVGTLVGYNPGVYDIVRQVYNLVSPILPNIPDDNSPGPHGTSTVSSVWQNTHRIISEVVKVILDALRRHHPSLLRVFRDVLPKLFRAVFLPSSAPPQVILKHVVFLVKLLEPIWDKLPHQADLSPPELVYHLYRIIKLIRQLVVVDKNFPQIPRDTSQANPLDGAMRKIYYLLKRDGDCVNRETVVQFSREIQNLKSAFPKIPASALKALQAQLPELVLSLKNSCSNSLIHRYVKDLESSLFRYWGIQEKEDVPDDLFVQPILKSIRLHDLEQDLWDNLGDYLAALVGPSASASLRASLAKLNGLIKRFFKRMIIYEPNDYEVKSVALRISNLLAGALSIPYKIVSLLRSLVIGGLQLIRDVIHGRREVHNVEDIIYGAANKIGGILSGSPIYQIMSHLPLMKLRGNILNSINQYTKQIADYQKSIRKFVAKIEVLKGVNKPTSRPLEQLLYRLPPIVKEMTTCSDILPYKSYDYFHKLLSSLSGRAIPRDLSYKLVNLISQVRGQRCADHVSLPESLRHLDTYLPGQSFKKWHAKFATRKAFTQIAFANSVNVRLKNHLLYTIQHLLGTIQPYVVTNQQTAGEFVNSVRDWASSLEHTINQPQQRHSVKRSVFILSAKFTAILRPQQKQPPQELTDKLMGLSNSILEWYQAPSPHPLRYHTSRDIQDVVKVLKSINQDVDTSQFQDIIELLVTYLQGYTVNKDNTLDNPSSHITSTILDLIGKDPPPQVKQQLIQRTKSILAVLRNKSACLSKYSSENAQREVQDYINYIQRVLRTNLGPENQYLLQHLLEKAALSVTSTAMRPSVYAVPAPYEYLRPSYVDTCSPTTRSVLSIIPTGEHSFSQLWNLNLITALDTVKKGILLFLDDYSGNELARNVKEFLDIVLSVVINDAISDSEKLPFAIRLALRINNGVVIPGNRDTLKSVRDIIDLTDLLSGIRSSYAQKDTRNVHPIVNSLVHKVSYLYGSAPSPQFAQSFHQLIEHVGSRNSQDGPELLRLIDRTTHSVRDNWGHVVTPAKRISLNLALRNLLVNIVKRISNSAEPISTWQSVLESFHHVAKVIAPNSNPNVTVDLLERVVYAIQESYQCRSSSHSPISKHLSNLLKHIGNIAYEGEGGHDFQQYTAFDHLLNNVMAIACTKAKPHDKADYIVQDYNKYLRTLGLPESFAKNQIQRLFSIMLHNLASSREVFYVNIQSVVLALVHDVFKTLRTPVTAVKEQRLTVLIENLLEVIKHNVFQEQQIQNIVKIVNSLLWYPNNEHLHFGLNNAFYQLLRSITEDNSYSRLPKVTELLRNIRVGLILSAVNHVPLTSTQILMASRLQPQLYPSLIKALDDLSRSLENRQSHQPDGPLFDALVNLVEEIEKVLVPTKKVQSVQQAKRVVVDDLTQIIQHYLPPQTREAVVMKTIGVIDEFINKLQIHFGIILPKPVRRAAAASGVPESTLLSNLSPAVLLAEFKGSAVNKFA